VERDRIPYFLARRKLALAAVDQIERQGWRFQKRDGDDVRDITAERLAQKHSEIETWMGSSQRL
jgi:hypothetical protein